MTMTTPDLSASSPPPRAVARERRRLLAAAFAAGLLALTGAGVYAGLNATATGSESVTSGTLSLTLGKDGNSAGFPQSVSNMAPGDTTNTYVTLTNGTAGGLAGQNLTLSVTGSPATSTLITPPAADGSTGLQVSVTQCSVAWTVTVGTPGSASCSGSTTTLLSPSSVASLSSPATLVSGTIPAGQVYHLQVSLTLPSSLTETTTNGTPPTTTIQGQSVTLSYSFGESQRTGATTTT